MPVGTGKTRTFDAQSISMIPGEDGLPIEKSKSPQKHTTSPINRVKKTKAGVIWINSELGNDQPPVFFQYPNFIVRNTTNDLFKFCNQVNPSLGPAKLRWLQLLGRVLCYAIKENRGWTPEQYFKKMDEFHLGLLRKAGYLDVAAEAE